jgi:SGNH hydrolase-like domain, acetyltransferase AlgX
MLDRKRLVFSALFGAVLLAATLAGLEILSSFVTPAWPARALVSREPAPVRVLGTPYERQPWLAEPDNSWGMRDRERTIAKLQGTSRAVFVGDSFVESRFTPLSLPAAVEQQLPKEAKIETINLAVGGTDPRSYYYRIRDVALALHPDAVLLFIYAGNDFVAANQGYSIWPRLLDESPGGSLIGSIMPRTNWLLVNRLDLSEFLGSQSKAPPNATEILYAAITAPPDERLKRLVAYVKTYHFPEVPEERIAEILSRGNNRFLDIALPHDGEQEYLLDSMVPPLISWETWNFKVPATRQEAPQFAGDGKVEATLSWIEATDRLLRSHGVPLLVFLAPVGSVDPDYADFWKPWPRPYSWNYICEEMHARLATALAKDGLRYVDLRENLANIPGTYRKLDGHWSQKGEAIVADRVALELRSLVRSPVISSQTKAGGSSSIPDR